MSASQVFKSIKEAVDNFSYETNKKEDVTFSVSGDLCKHHYTFEKGLTKEQAEKTLVNFINGSSRIIGRSHLYVSPNSYFGPGVVIDTSDINAGNVEISSSSFKSCEVSGGKIFNIAIKDSVLDSCLVVVVRKAFEITNASAKYVKIEDSSVMRSSLSGDQSKRSSVESSFIRDSHMGIGENSVIIRSAIISSSITVSKLESINKKIKHVFISGGIWSGDLLKIDFENIEINITVLGGERVVLEGASVYPYNDWKKRMTSKSNSILVAIYTRIIALSDYWFDLQEIK